MTERARTDHLVITLSVLLAIAGTPNAFANDHNRDDFASQIVVTQPTGFDAINFPIEAIQGDIEFNANAGWIWNEGNTHRLLLERDVDVIFGNHRFVAARANIWLSKKAFNQETGSSTYQVYAIFEDLRSADGTVTMQAQQMPVRGVIEIPTTLGLHLDAQFDTPPKSKSNMGKFLERTNEIYTQRVLGSGNNSSGEQANAQVRPWSSDQVDPTSKVDEIADQTSRENSGSDPSGSLASLNDPTGASSPVFQSSGIFSLSIGGKVVIDGAAGVEGSVITADGGVTLQYQDPANQQWVDFQAERLVIYTRGDTPVDGVTRIGAGQIEGIYLEGGVFAGDNQWSMRSPRMYLDVVNNKALMLDAVFWTTDQKTRMPLYVRAESIRQRASDEFHANKARISNTSFFEPDMTIGVSDITVSLDDSSTDQNTGSSDSNPNVTVEGKNVTLNVGDLPVLWLPGFKGDPSSFPLKQISVGDSNRSGAAIKTRWDAVSLFKMDTPPGVKIDLNLDYYTERGPAVGVTASWNSPKHHGNLFSYVLFNDNGTDIAPSGQRLDRDGETRGIIAFEDIWDITPDWTLVSELSYISDEAFVSGLFEDLGRNREAFRNRVQLERYSESTQFAIEMSSPINDFITPEHQLQSPGYQVSKVPEARYVSLAKDVFHDTNPGLLSYSFEARAGVLRLNFSEVDAREYGLTTDSLADDAFGTTANESLGDHFRSLGLDESAVTRLDTRHELRARFDLGHLRIVPFAAGRVTAYDTDFNQFSPDQTDELRYWGGGGVTLSTTVQRVNNDVESRFFDLHRMRHIIEPSLTIWGGDSNFDQEDTPIYDDDVEGLIKGTAVRAAIDQTWQTKRGGIGRWRDVDVLKLRTEYVWSSETAGNSPIPDFYTTRPELSNPGEYIGLSAVWQPTEVLAIAGETVYDLDLDRTARASIGAIIEHRPGFTTSIEYREVQPLEATFGLLAARYRLSDKYELNTSVNYNFDLGDFQTFNAQLLRRFQIGTLGTRISYDNIRGETSFGFVFRPAGSSGDIKADPSWGG